MVTSRLVFDQISGGQGLDKLTLKLTILRVALVSSVEPFACWRLR